MAVCHRRGGGRESICDLAERCDGWDSGCGDNGVGVAGLAGITAKKVRERMWARWRKKEEREVEKS